MNYVISPLATIPMIISKRNAALPLFKRIEKIVVNEEFDSKEELVFGKAITISDLRFSYEEKDIIKNINLNIEKDKSYAIVGTSGSGKTTLLNLLSGRNKNYIGEIKYDNLELKDISLSSLYNQLSYVEQNVFVFDDTIANNVTLYSKIDEDLYNEIIEKSGLDKLLKEKGNDYKCGENGSNLSGGERQRISIARALLKKSKIILMDEVTSALDTDTAFSVMNNILNLKDMTKIIITHNLEKNILKQFDEIIVISDGYIVEKGTFDNLLQKEGMFYSLYNFNNK
jgi:ABC-type bacteriocin/lantibiotic exporter with double-glycine peptidase domain